MIEIYPIMATIAVALRDSTTVRDYCISASNLGCLVQVDDIADNPLTDADAPFIILAKGDPGELGAVAAYSSMMIRMVCGMSLPAVRFVDTTARSATANGYRTLAAGATVEGLLRASVTVVKGIAYGSGILVEACNPDVDIYTLSPLQLAGCNIVVKQTQDLSTF